MIAPPYYPPIQETKMYRFEGYAADVAKNLLSILDRTHELDDKHYDYWRSFCVKRNLRVSKEVTDTSTISLDRLLENVKEIGKSKLYINW